MDHARRSPRVTPRAAIEGHTHFDASVQVIDISANGALVETSRPLSKGSLLRLELEPNDDDAGAGAGGGGAGGDDAPLALRARVLRVSPTADGQFRLGLQFEDLTDACRERLDTLLTKRSRPERRSTRRINVTTGANLRKEVELEVVNLGLFGGLFRLDFPLEFESEHDFVFRLPEGEVRVRGLVRHCEASMGPGPARTPRFQLGVEFTGLEGGDRERVVRYFEAQEKTEDKDADDPATR